MRKLQPLVRLDESAAPNGAPPERFVINDETVEPHNGAKIVLSAEIPRAVLRRTFPTLWQVFTPFSETVSMMMVGAIDGPRTLFRFVVEEYRDFGFESVGIHELAQRFRTDPQEARGYSILLALFYRIGCAHNIMDSTDDRKQVLMLQLFIDTHVDICAVMIRHKMLLDSDLLDPTDNPYSFGESVFAQFYPHDARFQYSGDMPDLTPIIDMGTIWHDTVRPQTAENITHALIHIICCKTQPFICQKRNNTKIIFEYINRYPDIFFIFKKLLFVALLGNYLHCLRRPNFVRRLDIHYFFNYATPNDIMLWMDENDVVVRAATKELYAHVVEAQYALDVFLTSTDHWRNVRWVYFDDMDKVRGLIDASETREDFLAGMNKVCKLMKAAIDPYIRKLKKMSFETLIFKEMERFNCAPRRRGRSRAPRGIVVSEVDSTVHLESEAFIGHERAFRINQIVASLVRARRNVQGNILETKWLKCLGVSDVNYNAFRRLYYSYTFNDISARQIKEQVAHIWASSQDDFHVIRAFLGRINAIRDSMRYYLPDDFVQRQSKALRAKYTVHPWEPLPAHMATFYYCRICRKWASPVISTNKQSEIQNVYAQGTTNFIYDGRLGAMVCESKPSAAQCKKDVDSMRSRTPKGYRSFVRAHLCKKTPLEAVNMLGIVQSLNGRLWALCEVCGGLTQFEGTKFGPLGFTCGMHGNEGVEIDAVARLNPVLRQEECAPPKCFFCHAVDSTQTFTPVRLLDDEHIVDISDSGVVQNKRGTGLSPPVVKQYWVCPKELPRYLYCTNKGTQVIRHSRAVHSILLLGENEYNRY